jgi:hypothetical protein
MAWIGFIVTIIAGVYFLVMSIVCFLVGRAWGGKMELEEAVIILVLFIMGCTSLYVGCTFAPFEIEWRLK